MSFRPITDIWLLARPKVKYYGAYPNGFLERARDLMGVGQQDGVLHVCAGRVRAYPNPRCLSDLDIMLDLDAALNPDIVADAADFTHDDVARRVDSRRLDHLRFALADPPYTPIDADRYRPGRERWPDPNRIVKAALDVVPVGGRVGILSLGWPRYPKQRSRQIAVVGVYVGNGNAGRTFAVYERTK